MNNQFKIISTGAIVIAMLMNGCGGSSEQKQSSEEIKSEASGTANSNDPMKNKGIGPIQSITLGPLDQAMADEGQKILSGKMFRLPQTGGKVYWSGTKRNYR